MHCSLVRGRSEHVFSWKLLLEPVPSEGLFFCGVGNKHCTQDWEQNLSHYYVQYFYTFFPFSTASTTEVTTIPTSVLNQVMDQATLSTMQAEMIAVQVLSQSATGDIQYLQHQSPRFIPIVTSADPSTLNSLQATLSQMPLATLQVRMMDVSMLCLKLFE